MAFSSSGLHLRSANPSVHQYYYDASSDTMATVLGAAYIDNEDSNQKFVIGAMIYVKAADGNMMARVSDVGTTGTVVLQWAGGDLPIRTWATGTEAGMTKLSVGMYEFGSTIATATRAILPTPYVGAEMVLLRVGSGTEAIVFDAGASASDVSLAASGGAAGGGTGPVYDAVVNRRIQTRYEGEFVHLKCTSTTRWRIIGMNYVSSGSEDLGGGASFFLSST